MSGVTVRQCVLLVGEAEGPTLPRALMSYGGRPFLAWIMREMQRFGVGEFVLLIGHLSQEIERAVDQIHAFLPRPAQISISVAPFRSGTGGALHHARKYLRERFLLCSGTSIFSCNLSRFLSRARSGNWMLLRSTDDPDQDVGDVFLYGEEDAVACLPPEAAHTGQSGLHDSGVYLFDQSIFEHLTGNCSLKNDVLTKLVREGKLHGMSLTGYFRDISLQDDLAVREGELPEVLIRPAVFLDRDGVINRDHGWVGTRERFEWEQDVLAAIARMTDSGHHVFIVTNQSGIARGFYSEEDLAQLMDWVIDTIREHGGTVDDWRYCPMHPEAAIAQYRGQSSDRKPAPGMILDLLKRWELKPERCVLYGDQPSDMQAAAAAGVKSILVGPSSLAELISHKAEFA